jgi:hypothetical protein
MEPEMKPRLESDLSTTESVAVPARRVIVDHELFNRVEDGIAAERSAFADGMAALQPELEAGWIPVAGGRAIFTGAGFFTNRAMAMGAADLSALTTSVASRPFTLSVACRRKSRSPRWCTAPHSVA